MMLVRGTSGLIVLAAENTSCARSRQMSIACRALERADLEPTVVQYHAGAIVALPVPTPSAGQPDSRLPRLRPSLVRDSIAGSAREGPRALASGAVCRKRGPSLPKEDSVARPSSASLAAPLETDGGAANGPDCDSGPIRSP